MKGKKTGGRQKGTPNKTSAETKLAISKLLSQYQDSGRMLEDFNELEPRERITIAERLMQYVLPKMKSVEMELNQTSEKSSIEDDLRRLSGEHN